MVTALDDQARERLTMETSIAKYHVIKAIQKVVDQSLQLRGRIEYICYPESLISAAQFEGSGSTRGISGIQLLIIGRELMRLQTLEHEGRL